MRVLNWLQNRLHEPHRSDDELDHRPPAAMLSIGMLGVVEGHEHVELRKMQEELTLLMGAKGVAAPAGDKKGYLTHKSGGIVTHRSFRKFMSSALSSFLLPTTNFRGTMPEMPCPLPHNNMPNDDLAMNRYQTAQLPWRGKAMDGEQESKWIKTDSEYIVLEINLK